MQNNTNNANNANQLTKDITSVKLAREVLIDEIYSRFDDPESLQDVIDCVDDLIDITEMEVRIQKNKEIQELQKVK